jgi:hypothetical protein
MELKKEMKKVQFLLKLILFFFNKKSEKYPSYGFTILWQQIYYSNEKRTYLQTLIFGNNSDVLENIQKFMDKIMQRANGFKDKAYFNLYYYSFVADNILFTLRGDNKVIMNSILNSLSKMEHFVKMSL